MPSNAEKLGVPFEVPQEKFESFDFVSPTLFSDLPSQGKFYPEDHPLHKQDSVELYYMTARSEDILTNKALIKKGVAIDRLIQSLLVNKTINVDSLLVGDKNAIIIDVRTSGYGEKYNTKFTCPACETSQDYEFDLEEAKKVNPGVIPEGVSISPEGIFSCKLPRCQIALECKFLTGADEKMIMLTEEKHKKHNLPDSLMTDQLRSFIVSVNGKTDKGSIATVVDKMPAIDSRWLRNTYKQICPNVDLLQEFTCKICGESQEVSVPLGTNFFYVS